VYGKLWFWLFQHFVTSGACREISDTNKRIFFEDAYDAAMRKAQKQDLARQLKRASEYLRGDEMWSDARSKLLDKGFSIPSDMRDADAEKARSLHTGGAMVMHAKPNVLWLFRTECSRGILLKYRDW
jgi:hypothetical protein